MCGINGYVGTGESPIEKMNVVIAHRGPDFAGVYRDGEFSLGHRLLAIREVPEPSRQPYTREGSPWVLVFGGQIYNTRKLAEKFSIPFEDLDTAVMFSLIEKVGWDFVRHIQGMFTIALYNNQEKVLRVYRDSTGQKPLYFSTANGSVIFSSEIKSLLAAGVPKESDPGALMIAGALGYIPGNLTLFKDIKKLDAGEVLVVYSGGYSFERFKTLTDDHFSEDPEAVLAKVVGEHLASKQKVALNLSGGMDSSVLLHEMKHAGHTLTTYTTSFEDAGESFNDDAKIARKLAKDYGTTHTEIEITKDIFFNNFLRSYEIIEEPNYNISLPTYLEVAKREGIHGDGNRVILSGNGGDEVFGGYTYYGKSLAYEKLIKRMTPLLFNLGKWIRTGRYWNYGNPAERWLQFKYFDFNGMEIEKSAVRNYIETIATNRGITFGNPVRDLMRLDRTVWLPGENFIQADKLYMSESLELRSPLAYEPLRAYFDARLTTEDYLAGGGLTASQAQAGNKQYLRKIYKGKLPEYVVERKAKTGWRSPIRPWYDSRFKGLFLSILSGAPRGGVVNWDFVQREVEKKEVWPGKYIHLYLSLAILSKKYGITL